MMTAEFAVPTGKPEPGVSTGRERIISFDAAVPEIAERWRRWIADESWPRPKWFEGGSSPSDSKEYNAFLIGVVRSRYLELENDFRTVIGNFYDKPGTDLISAGRIFELLQHAREMLEAIRPDIFIVSGMLDLVERYLVWLYPVYIAIERLPWIDQRIDNLENLNREVLRKQIHQLFEMEPLPLGRLRALYEEVLAAWNRQTCEKAINGGLQIARLKTLRNWGGILLLILVFVCMLMARPESLSQFPVANMQEFSPGIAASVVAFGLSVMGAAGGFLSGLLHIRRTRVNLAQYQESVLSLQLKALVGAMVAVILFIFLSWEILPGIVVKTAGSYIVVAFLSGFSERYFLKLLSIEPDTGVLRTHSRSSMGPNGHDRLSNREQVRGDT
jgi:hypothetical protein